MCNRLGYYEFWKCPVRDCDEPSREVKSREKRADGGGGGAVDVAAGRAGAGTGGGLGFGDRGLGCFTNWSVGSCKSVGQRTHRHDGAIASLTSV
eukprot:1190050-Prorocentrum_minimum.AAC.4